MSFEIDAGTAMTDSNFGQLDQSDDEPREESQGERQQTVEQIEDFPVLVELAKKCTKKADGMEANGITRTSTTTDGRATRRFHTVPRISEQGVAELERDDYQGWRPRLPW